MCLCVCVCVRGKQSDLGVVNNCRLFSICWHNECCFYLEKISHYVVCHQFSGLITNDYLIDLSHYQFMGRKFRSIFPLVFLEMLP